MRDTARFTTLLRSFSHPQNRPPSIQNSMACGVYRAMTLQDGEKVSLIDGEPPPSVWGHMKILARSQFGLILLGSNILYEVFISIFSFSFVLNASTLLECNTLQFSVLVVLIDFSVTILARFFLPLIGSRLFSHRRTKATTFLMFAFIFSCSLLFPWRALSQRQGLVFWGILLGIGRAFFTLSSTIS